jgi:hypothetical protein
VRLTQSQCWALYRLVQPDVNRWLDEREQAAGTVQSWDVTMPAAGWRYCLQALERRVQGPRGGILAGASKAQVNAMRRIATGLARLEAHPALRGIAVADPSTEVLYVWPVKGDWSIYPIEDRRMFVLWPERVKWGGMTVTKWQPTVPVSGGLADQWEHLVFVELAPKDPRQVVGHRPVDVAESDAVILGDVE